MIHYKTNEEIEVMRHSALLVGKTIAEVAALIRPGMTTAKLDEIADEIVERGVRALGEPAHLSRDGSGQYA